MTELEIGAPRYFFPKKYADSVQRLRVPSGFLLLAAFAWFSKPSPLSMLAGLPLSVLGLSLRGWAAGHLAKNTELAASGPYAYMRNPLYAGTLIAAAGIVTASRSIWLVFIFGAAFLLVYLPAIELEEQHLRVIFPNYGEYAARVNRFLPFSRWPLGGERGSQAALGSPSAVNAEAPRSALPAFTGNPFSWPLYRRNEEYKASLGFAVAAAWLGWKCWLFLSVS